MMHYFNTTAKQEKLKCILDSWLSPPTPFRHHCGVKGLGCDCIHFAARVYEEAGYLTWKKGMIPDYPKDWHIHNTRELLADTIVKYNCVKRINLLKLLNGDIILSHHGKAASHVGIYFDEYVYQALNKIGVCKIAFADESFRKRMRFAYRLLK